MFISDKDRFVFVHIPKTAGSAMHVYFKDYYNLTGNDRLDPEPKVHHQTYSEVIKGDDKLREYFSFAFVRNPWERLLSGFMDFKFKREKNYSGKITYDKPMIADETTFSQFVEELESSWFYTDVHFKKQVLFLESESGKRIDFIGKYENLKQDFQKVCNLVGVQNLGLGHHRGTSHDHYTRYYNSRTKNIVGDLFSEDIREFGYEFGS